MQETPIVTVPSETDTELIDADGEVILGTLGAVTLDVRGYQYFKRCKPI